VRTLRAGLCLLGLLACSTPPAPEPTRYLMRAGEPAASAENAAASRVGLRRVGVAPYLRLPGLALETEPHQIRHARHHRWAEPLEHGLRSLLRAELAAALDQEVDADPTAASRWEYAVDVEVDQLHGTADGDALLVASWRVTRLATGSERARGRFVRRQPLTREGYPALVEAQIELARLLASEIAESLRGSGDAG
jgi:uncharacterized lipoprotein YmbA